MKISLVGLVLRQTRVSMRHLFWSHTLTCGTMAIALFVVGAFMFLQTNLERWLRNWGDQIQITAYMRPRLETTEVENLIRRVEALPQVERVHYTSQTQAWRDFQAALGTQSGLLDGLPQDVLPASIEVTIKPEQRDSPAIEQFAKALMAEKGIASVEYPQQWVERLGLIVLGVAWGKWLLGGVLFLASFFVVGSTIKLAIFARRDEVEIMQLVGASEALIEAPFVLEGTLEGLAGAAISLLALWGSYLFLRSSVPPLGVFFQALGGFEFLDPRQIGLLVAMGALLGAAGGVFSLRRFMKTWRALD